LWLAMTEFKSIDISFELSPAKGTIFTLIADLAWVSGAKKIGQPLKVDRNSRLVAGVGGFILHSDEITKYQSFIK